MTSKTRNYVGFRLNSEEDMDIMQDEAKYADRTQRWKDVYRKVLLLESGSLPLMYMESNSNAFVNSPTTPSIAEEHMPEPKPLEPLVWKFPTEEPKGKASSTHQKPDASAKANILSNIQQGF